MVKEIGSISASYTPINIPDNPGNELNAHVDMLDECLTILFSNI
jgi:hypothetical protein